ncbi:hypothetical protein ISS07_01430 [Candidatus Woesearchaeota archaeon]|nr:hypothetical protein [Candidatus Woesearchaeota archaeon]
MKKRGAATLWMLIELVAAFLVAYIAVDVSLAYAQGTGFEKLNVAREIGLNLVAISSVPGDSYLVNDNLQGYSLRVYSGKIEVFEKEDDFVKGVYTLPKSDLVGNFGLKNLEGSKKIVISKIDNKVMISEKIPDFFDT